MGMRRSSLHQGTSAIALVENDILVTTAAVIVIALIAVMAVVATVAGDAEIWKDVVTAIVIGAAVHCGQVVHDFIIGRITIPIRAECSASTVPETRGIESLVRIGGRSRNGRGSR